MAAHEANVPVFVVDRRNGRTGSRSRERSEHMGLFSDGRTAQRPLSL